MRPRHLIRIIILGVVFGLGMLPLIFRADPEWLPLGDYTVTRLESSHSVILSRKQGSGDFLSAYVLSAESFAIVEQEYESDVIQDIDPSPYDEVKLQRGEYLPDLPEGRLLAGSYDLDPECEIELYSDDPRAYGNPRTVLQIDAEGRIRPEENQTTLTVMRIMSVLSGMIWLVLSALIYLVVLLSWLIEYGMAIFREIKRRRGQF